MDKKKREISNENKERKREEEQQEEPPVLVCGVETVFSISWRRIKHHYISKNIFGVASLNNEWRMTLFVANGKHHIVHI